MNPAACPGAYQPIRWPMKLASYRAGDAQQDGQDNAHAVIAGFEETCEQTDDEADEDDVRASYRYRADLPLRTPLG